MNVGLEGTVAATPYRWTMTVSGTPQSRQFLNWHDNNVFSQRCPGSVVLLLDNSTNVSSPNFALAKQAVINFVTDLEVSSFDPTYVSVLLFSGVVNNTITGDTLTEPNKQSLLAQLNSIAKTGNNLTNWDLAFRDVPFLPNISSFGGIVILITAGDPTAFNDPPEFNNPLDVTFASLEAAIASANQVKSIVQPLELISIGIGAKVTQTNLELVSSTTPGSVTMLGSYLDLDNELRQIALDKLCTLAICVHGDTLVSTPRGQLPIAQIEPGDIVFDAQGREQVVQRRLNNGKAVRFISIKEGALGPNVPSGDLLLTPGHPVLINGREIECQNLVDDSHITEVKLGKAAPVYNLCTVRRTFVSMQGCLVGTWSEAAYENFIENDSFGARHIAQ